MWTPQLDTDRLLSFLRAEWGAPALDWTAPPERLSGGLETYTHALGVVGRGAPRSELVLRRFHPQEDPTRALFEALLMNAVADSGFPAPRALAWSNDVSVIGSSFVVMEKLAGLPLVRLLHRPAWAGRIMAELQLRLHALDPEPVRAALASEGFVIGGFAERLDVLERRVRAAAESLLDGLAWIREHAPPDSGRRSLIHGDCNPANVLMLKGRVNGLVDWAATNASISDPVVEFASTRTMVSLLRLPWMVRWHQHRLARSYVARYSQERRFDEELVRFHSLATCMWLFAFVAEWRAGVRAVPDEHRPRGATDWGGDGVLDGYVAYFRAHTGIELTIP